MELQKSHLLIKALADSSRIMLMNSLIKEPQCVEELAKRMKLAVSTVSFHLKKLEMAQLVRKEKDQYYMMYFANLDFLEMTLGELIRVDGINENEQDERLRKYRNGVLKAFFRNGRITHLPVQKKKRRIVLEEILSRFSVGRRYSEKDVNEIISKVYEDYCTVRREFIYEKMMRRENQYYWIELKEDEVVMDKRAQLKKDYKLNPPPPGIFKITNRANGKIFIGRAQNVQGRLNGQESQLRWGGHPNRQLQEDCKKFGIDQFTFEVLDTLKVGELTQDEIISELEELELLWLEKLKPYGDIGYNDFPDKKKLAKK